MLYLIKKLIKRSIKNIIFLIDLFVARYFRVPYKRYSVTVIRLDAIGDFILWLSVAKHLKQIYPNRSITLVANSIWSDLAKTIPYWDKVVVVDVGRFSFNPLTISNLLYRWKIIKVMSLMGSEVVFQPTIARSLKGGDSLIRASNARVRIGSVGDLSNISADEERIGNKWYTELVPIKHTSYSEVEANFNLINSISETHFPVAGSSISPGPVRSTFDINMSYAVIVPGASANGRRWPLNNFVEISQYLQNKFKLKIVLLGTREEIELCKSIRIEVPEVIDFSGKTSLLDMVEIIRGASLLVSNETSAAHIAYAVDTRSICILGGGHFGRFLPYPDVLVGAKPQPIFSPMPCFSCNWKCSMTDRRDIAFPCIDAIKVVAVKDLIDAAMNMESKKPMHGRSAL